jgi:PAS domain S-box-containing protein
VLDVAVIGTDLAGIVGLWNPAAERLYGWSRAEVIGRPIGELTVGPDDAQVAANIMAHIRDTGSWEGEFWVRRRDHTRCLAYVRDVVVLHHGAPVGIVGVSLDLTPAPQSAKPRAARSHR